MTTDTVESLREELRLAKECNLAVVRRLQAEVDDLKTKLAASQAQSADYEVDSRLYHNMQYYADASGGFGGERI